MDPRMNDAKIALLSKTELPIDYEPSFKNMTEP